MTQFCSDYLQKRWADGKSIIYKGKKYTVHKMSYGAYFLEPVGYKGGERDPFHPNTLWLERIKENPNIYQVNKYEKGDTL